MKIAIIFPNNTFTAPHLGYYLDILEKQEVAYDLILWDRKNLAEEASHIFSNPQTKDSKFGLFVKYWKFRSFVIDKLNSQDYDKVILFTAQMGIFLKRRLAKEYKNNYIMDIRDYSDIISIFPNRFDKVVKNSKKVHITSYGFTKWLPKSDKYAVSHNLSVKTLNDFLKGNLGGRSYFQNDKINLVTMGSIRDFHSNSLVIESLKDNPNFDLKFIGSGPCVPDLEAKVNKENISNVTFYGKYKKEDEPELLKSADFVNILLDDNKLSRHLTTYRIYTAALLQIPCMVNANTEQGRIMDKYKFGIIIKNYDEIPQKISSFKESFDKEQFIAGCTAFLKDVKKDYDLFENNVINFITR